MDETNKNGIGPWVNTGIVSKRCNLRSTVQGKGTMIRRFNGKKVKTVTYDGSGSWLDI